METTVGCLGVPEARQVDVSSQLQVIVYSKEWDIYVKFWCFSEEDVKQLEDDNYIILCSSAKQIDSAATEAWYRAVTKRLGFKTYAELLDET